MFLPEIMPQDQVPGPPPPVTHAPTSTTGLVLNPQPETPAQAHSQATYEIPHAFQPISVHQSQPYPIHTNQLPYQMLPCQVPQTIQPQPMYQSTILAQLSSYKEDEYSKELVILGKLYTREYKYSGCVDTFDFKFQGIPRTLYEIGSTK